MATITDVTGTGLIRPFPDDTAVNLPTVEPTPVADIPVQPEVDADRLVTGTTPITLPTPEVEQFPDNAMATASAVSNGIGAEVDRQSEAEKALAERQAEFAALGVDGDLSSLFRDTQERFGVTGESLTELKDIQLQLADIDTGSRMTEVQIAGAAGQTLAQGGREITQEQRENAVRTAGLAARASVLQGNINTARQLAMDAVNIAYKDRELTNTNIIKQIDMLQGRVDKEYAAELLTEKNKREDDQLKVKDLKTAISNAIVAGASQEEMRTLHDPLTSDEEKIALARSVSARKAREDSALDRQLDRANLAKALRAPTQVIEEGGRKHLINTQTGQILHTYGEGDFEGVQPYVPGSVEEATGAKQANDIASLSAHAGLNSSVGPVGLTRVAIADVGGAKKAFIGQVENMLSILTLNTFAEAKAKGMTFGAMSQGEWDILASSASVISQWRKYKDDDKDKSVVGYAIDEESFKDELNVLTQYSKLGFINKGGNPEDVGVAVMDDGTYVIENSNGTFTELK